LLREPFVDFTGFGELKDTEPCTRKTKCRPLFASGSVFREWCAREELNEGHMGHNRQ
jgi:hypothetical protein